MARTPDWQKEVRDSLRKEAWSLRGMSQVIKVLPAEGPIASHLGGYITLGKFLVLKTPEKIEKDLGLLPGTLKNGARIYRFVRLPQNSEYEYDLTAAHPGGLAYNPAWSKYPSGSAKIPQWKIKDGIQIRVDSRNVLELKPGEQFPSAWLMTL